MQRANESRAEMLVRQMRERERAETIPDRRLRVALWILAVLSLVNFVLQIVCLILGEKA